MLLDIMDSFYQGFPSGMLWSQNGCKYYADPFSP